MDQKLIENFFSAIHDPQKIEFLKSKLFVPLGTDKTSDLGGDFAGLQPKEELKMYLECQEKFNQAETKLKEIKERVKRGDITAVHELNLSGAIYDMYLKTALENWVTIGYKNEIEKLISL